ncbi:unnamed protein product [Brassica napus]|uniref:(rape) hypothetical protein n=1 Tax=Brassica napus TaxID=3708 RepID=A0A817AHB1_BRANA|nr:unnamed protein product [Brassica napus]
MGMALGVRELEIPHCKEDFEEYTLFKLLKTLYTNEKLQVLKPTYTVTLDVPLYTQGSTVFKYSRGKWDLLTWMLESSQNRQSPMFHFDYAQYHPVFKWKNYNTKD